MTDGRDDDSIGSFYMGRTRMTPPPRRVMPRGLLTVITVAAFAGLVWYAYPQGQEKYTDMDVPVIAADTSAYKAKPSDPGGMDVPHRDSTVYESLNRKSAPSRPEKVVKKKEEPLDRKKLGLDPPAPALNLNPEAAPAVAEEAKAGETKIEEGKTEETKTEEAKTGEVKTEDAKTETEAISPPAEAEQGPAVPAADAVPTYFDESATMVWLQLGAFKTEETAKTGWQRLQKKHAGLKDMTMRTQKADLGKKGVLYRLQAGAPSAEKAKEVCTAVNAAGGACVVVK